MWLLGAALAVPPNGDFESGLTGWSDVSTPPGEVLHVVQGDDFSLLGADTTGLTFTSPTGAVMLRGGASASVLVASLESSEFVVRHESLTLQVFNESELTTAQAFLFETGGGSTSTPLDAPAGGWAPRSLDVSASCGTIARLRINQSANVEHGFTLIDDITGQTVCADYLDSDGDGMCRYGYDVDFDGACLGDDEAQASALGEIDCDDTDDAIHDGANEVPDDGIDQNCDGVDQTAGCFVDLDGDGYGTAPTLGPPGCIGPSTAPLDGDCDDTRADRNPGAIELCDGIDNDCDGLPELAPVDTWADQDGDGFGDPTTLVTLCGPVVDRVEVAGDCDDDEALVYPGATEIPADGVDQDCDGRESCFTDVDMDGYAGAGVAPVTGLTCPDGLDVAEDCDDTDFTINPGQTEACDGQDNDCDGEIDDGLSSYAYYLDLDGDNFGTTSLQACAPPGPDYSTVGGDCDDQNAAIHPGATEIPIDGVDQDCSGGDACYRDNDGDDFGTPGIVDSADLDCLDDGEARNDLDCDDLRPEAYPGATEIVGNGLDEDCDGMDEIDGDPGPSQDGFVLGGGVGCSTSAGPGVGWLSVLALMGRRTTDR